MGRREYVFKPQFQIGQGLNVGKEEFPLVNDIEDAVCNGFMVVIWFLSQY